MNSPDGGFDFDLFAGSMLDAVVLADSNDCITYVNGMAEELFGYAKAELVGGSLTRLMPERYAQGHRRGMERMRRGEPARFIGQTLQLAGLKKDGTEFPIELSLSSWGSAGERVFSGIIRDMTERRKAEQRAKMQLALTRLIAESRTLLEAATRVIETICDGMEWDIGAMWIHDPHTNVLRCLQYWDSHRARRSEFERETLALRLSKGESLPGRTLAQAGPVWVVDLAADEDFHRSRAAAEIGLRTAFGFPIIDEHDQTVGVLEFFTEHQRKPDPLLLDMMANVGRQIGTLLARSEAAQAVSSVVEQMQIGILIYHMEDPGDDRSLRMISVNPSASEILGIPADELVGHRIDENFPAIREHGLPAVYAKVALTQESVQLQDVSYGDDRVGPAVFASKAFPLPNHCVGVSFENITSRKHTEQLIAAERQRFDSFMRHAPLVAFTKDSESRYVWINEEFEKRFGIALSDVRGKRDSDLFDQESAEKNLMNDRKVLEGGLPIDTSTTMSTADGVERSWLMMKFPLRLASGESQIGGVAIDVTDRKVMERQLEQTERISGLGRLAANIAHEINNVLMGILPFAEVIKRRARDDQSLVSAATHIGRSIERGRRITQEILAFTRATEPDLQAFNCRAWFEGLGPDLELLLGEGIELQMVPPSAEVFVRGDALQLQQALTNLSLNARDAMGGTGKLTIAAGQCSSGDSLSFGAATRPGEFVHLTVEDTGEGIPPDIMGRIFEPLFTTKREAGTGLGLAITHQLIAKHGGEIHVESVQGQGTTFHVLIPCAPRPLTTSHPTPARIVAPMKRVVLVEDELSVGEGLVALLEDDGIAVHWVRTGAEAAAAIESFHPELLILDVGLPDINGFDLYREIRIRFPDLPTIFSTGHGEKSAVDQFENAPVVLLMKPYDYDTLITTASGLFVHAE